MSTNKVTALEAGIMMISEEQNSPLLKYMTPKQTELIIDRISHQYEMALSHAADVLFPRIVQGSEIQAMGKTYIIKAQPWVQMSSKNKLIAFAYIADGRQMYFDFIQENWIILSF